MELKATQACANTNHISNNDATRVNAPCVQFKDSADVFPASRLKIKFLPCVFIFDMCL